MHKNISIIVEWIISAIIKVLMIVRDTIANIIRDGISQGVLRSDADPETIVRPELALMDGAWSRGLTIGDDECVRAVRYTLYECGVDDPQGGPRE